MVKNNLDTGSFVISLDFEMMWGAKDITAPGKYGIKNVAPVREVIDRLLSLFCKYGVHATFATVGLIFKHNKKEALDSLPSLMPAYDNMNLSPYHDDYIKNISEEYNHLYFAADIIDKLKANQNVEIGSHTYCHYYCWETGQTAEQFEADILEMNKTAKENNIEIESIVFPRNQVSDEYLMKCVKNGIKYYRGNSRKFFSQPKNKIESIYYKICRLLDAYINISGNMSTKYLDIPTEKIPINIPASRFLRPYMKELSMVDWLRICRIKKEMLYAAENNELYHLWWHPHNMGDYVDESMKILEDILRYYSSCHEKYGMKSYTMSEFAENIYL